MTACCACPEFGRLYVLDDGKGGLLFEHGSLVLLAEQIRQVLRQKSTGIVARISAAWLACRKVLEEKVEPFFTEEAEILSHFAALA